MTITLSILIPTYNRASYLKRLLLQLLQQTTQPLEILVVDDHSADNTAALVKAISQKHPTIRYLKNKGCHQREAKATGFVQVQGEYILILDDDAIIEDREFLAKLIARARPDRITQAKIILEQMGKRDEDRLAWKDYLAVKPYPILELLTSNYNRGRNPRRIFPLIEWGSVWHRKFIPFFLDPNLILDGYGESYSTSLRLYRAGIPLFLDPALVIRHPGSTTGGSNKFQKKTMLQDFTKFHEGYFYNIVYLHRRYFPYFVWLWLPFYAIKSLLALAINQNFSGWYAYAAKPIARALKNHPYSHAQA